MKIKTVTITGADNKVSQSALKNLSEAFPYVEWGILFSSNREGTQRYPSMAWLEGLLKYPLNLSAHFCGTWAKAILEHGKFDFIRTLNPAFKRVQLNYNFSNNTDWNLGVLLQFVNEYDERDIILQYNKSNSKVLDALMGNNNLPSNLHFLHDSSGGRGSVIQSFKHPFKTFTGYAGGLDVENVWGACANIALIKSEQDCWIDLESGARTNNEFDLKKVENILLEVTQFVNSKGIEIDTFDNNTQP